MASYKKEAEKLRSENELKRQANEHLERELKKAQDKLKDIEAKDKKRYSAIVYCTNCLHVNNVSIPPGVTLKDGDCVTCRVRGTQMPVVDYPGKNRF